MKIAYVGNFSQAHCTEVHLALTLEDLGHKMVRLQENELSRDWVNELDDDVDFVLYTRTWGEFVTMEDIQHLRELFIPTASYHLDLYVGLKREDGLDNDPFWRTDYVFTPDGDPASAEVFKRKGINHFYIKPGVFKGECYIKPPAKFSHDELGNDVVFVGGGSATDAGPQYGHPEWAYRGKLIKWLQDTYGERFSKYGWPQETVRNDPLNQLYANSKVAVGDSLCLQNFTHPYYWSDRAYETIGRGGFLIHPYIKGMEEEFTDGETIVFYEFGNFYQLKEKIDYYLEHEDERLRIRDAGHEFVKNHATYHDRLSQMLETIKANPLIVNNPGYKPENDDKPEPKLEFLNENGARHYDYPIKISLGAGAELEDPSDGWVNLDILALEGVDVVHNLMAFPYPFEDNAAEYIKAKDLIEHLGPYTLQNRITIIEFMKECYRILKPGGTLWIQTPGWDADFLWIDPTHVRGYDIRSMDFFDPDTDFGRSTGFYSDASFKVTATQLENKNLVFEMVKR